MRALIDKDIPFVQGVLEPFFDTVDYLPAREIDNAACRGADVLAVRTRTRCDESLLHDTGISLIVSATIGEDHVDREYLSRQGIAFVNAPGSNACGVMQYVHTSVFVLAARKEMDLRGKVFGVVGDGNTGERVARLAEYLGFEVLRNDIDLSIGRPVVSLEELAARSDIISFHVPLDGSTAGMLGESLLDRLKDGAVVINASRGGVSDEAALLGHRERLSGLILDVWNGEPSSVNRAAVDAADIATPHIAGYSIEGKANASAMIVRAIAAHFRLPALAGYRPELPARPSVSLQRGLLSDRSPFPEYMQRQCSLAERMQEVFPVMDIDRRFREDTASFEKLRTSCGYRHEFSVPEYISSLAAVTGRIV